jgi:hypothetical protein
MPAALIMIPENSKAIAGQLEVVWVVLILNWDNLKKEARGVAQPRPIMNRGGGNLNHDATA